AHRIAHRRPLLPLDRHAEGVRDRPDRAPPRHRRPDDARPRLPRQRRDRPQALARERADHLHPRRRAALPAGRRPARGDHRARGRGAAHPVERAAHGRGARGHARRRHLQPPARRLAEPHRLVLPPEV
ncbi:MAG: hypothetical protein AVDCRST_MAG40-3100, partial [uncultured Gemmatimonadaceae bacterium]